VLRDSAVNRGHSKPILYPSDATRPKTFLAGAVARSHTESPRWSSTVLMPGRLPPRETESQVIHPGGTDAGRPDAMSSPRDRSESGGSVGGGGSSRKAADGGGSHTPADFPAGEIESEVRDAAGNRRRSAGRLPQRPMWSVFHLWWVAVLPHPPACGRVLPPLGVASRDRCDGHGWLPLLGMMMSDGGLPWFQRPLWGRSVL
jgi:hypothetical protein